MTDEAVTTKSTKAGSLLNVPGVIDTKREAEGAWFTHKDVEGFEEQLLDENGNGLQSVRVCSRFTSAYRKEEQAMHSKAFRKPEDQRVGYVADETAILNSRLCVMDWKFTDRDGNKIPFSLEAVSTIYTSEGHEGILQFRYHRAFIEACIQKLLIAVEGRKERDAGE